MPCVFGRPMCSSRRCVAKFDDSPKLHDRNTVRDTMGDDPAASVILEENIDENYEPTTDGEPFHRLKHPKLVTICEPNCH